MPYFVSQYMKNKFKTMAIANLIGNATSFLSISEAYPHIPFALAFLSGYAVDWYQMGLGGMLDDKSPYHIVIHPLNEVIGFWIGSKLTQQTDTSLVKFISLSLAGIFALAVTSMKVPLTFEQRLEQMKNEIGRLKDLCKGESGKQVCAVKSQNKKLQKLLTRINNFETEYLCPISQSIMELPITLSTGGSVDRDNCLKYVKNANKLNGRVVCPVWGGRRLTLDESRGILPEVNMMRKNEIETGMQQLERRLAEIRQQIMLRPKPAEIHRRGFSRR